MGAAKSVCSIIISMNDSLCCKGCGTYGSLGIFTRCSLMHRLRFLQVEGQEHCIYFLQEINYRSAKNDPFLSLLEIQPCMLLIFSHFFQEVTFISISIYLLFG